MPTDTPLRCLVTCEHGGNRVPERWQALFRGHEALLASHRGYDPGALAMARDLAETLAAPLVAATVSRLVVDLNRSPGHPQLHAEPMRRAPRALREEALLRCYRPYRQRVERFVAEVVAGGGKLLHISSHSFTPVLGDEARRADVGFLYDPSRPAEAAFCAAWLAALKRLAPRLQLRRNYPYSGRSDGLCTWLRRSYPGERYLGVELEINQKHPLAGGSAWPALRRMVADACLEALSESPSTPPGSCG